MASDPEMTIDNDDAGSPVPEYLDEQQRIPRAEYIRLLQQALCELGYEQVSDGLREASGLSCESTQIEQLRENVKQGQWLQACESIAGCPGLTQAQLQQVQFKLLREHALEVCILKVIFLQTCIIRCILFALCTFCTRLA